MSSASTTPSAPPAVQRQIVLPLSKAVEIAYKNIRMRLSRSLLVTSGIVLALAFLMSIRTSDAVVNGMRAWIAASKRVEPLAARAAAAVPADLSPMEQQALAEQRQWHQRLAALKQEVAELTATLSAAAGKTYGNPPLNARDVLGAEFPALQREFGSLPGNSTALGRALAANPPLVTTMRQWIDQKRNQRRLEGQLKGARDLEATMIASGVPTDPKEVQSARVQTRWLLGLALLVAFVGILNAMLMSVTERFREIGTMKCLGALDTFIVKLFLIESLFQGVIGTILGILAGLLLTLASSAGSYGNAAFLHLPWGMVASSAVMCFLVGVALTVGGAVYPAWQAARMQPVEAMRVEA